jgi:hypothetical protein
VGFGLVVHAPGLDVFYWAYSVAADVVVCSAVEQERGQREDRHGFYHAKMVGWKLP